MLVNHIKLSYLELLYLFYGQKSACSATFASDEAYISEQHSYNRIL